MDQYSSVITIIAVIAFILYNQIRVKQVKMDTKFTTPLIMLILGVYSMIDNDELSKFTLVSWISMLISFTVLAIGMAAIRATTVKIWIEKEILYRQGTWLTVLLWAVSISLHSVLNRIGNVGHSTAFIYFAITFTVQKLIIKKRAEQIYAS